PNDPFGDVEDPRVGIYELRIDRPFDLSTRDDEGKFVDSITALPYLQTRLVGTAGITYDELLRVVEDVDGWRWYDTRRRDGDWVMGPLRDVADEAYIEPHLLADSPAFIDLVRRAGYDGLYYHGFFSSEDLFERPLDVVLAEGGYNHRDCTTEEWRPFHRSQVSWVSVIWLSPPVASGGSRTSRNGIARS